MILSSAQTAWNDYLYWKKTDKTKLKRINKLRVSQYPLHFT